jgi:hypothetical protein
VAEAVSFDPPQGEPPSILESATAGLGTVAHARYRRFEFSCRGDRVPLELLAPESDGPHPILLTQPAPGTRAGLPALRGLRTWLTAGVAIASIELPLFGRRRSAKLSDPLEAAVGVAVRGGAIDATSRSLWCEFARQSVMELRRALDVLATIEGAAPERSAFAGVGLAACLGAILCGVDPRVKGGVLAFAGGGFGPEAVDPAAYVGDAAPRPLLFIQSERPTAQPGVPAIPRSAALALHDAAREPKRIERRPQKDFEIADAAWEFLGPLLT